MTLKEKSEGSQNWLVQALELFGALLAQSGGGIDPRVHAMRVENAMLARQGAVPAVGKVETAGPSEKEN